MARQISEQQKAASRANGRKSRGPVTEQGKRNSSRNALKHGLLTNTLLIDDESRPRFEALVNALRDSFDPQDAAECLHVETIAAARWRQVRLWSIQTAAINYEIRRQSSDVLNEDPTTRAMLAMRTLDDTSHSQRNLSLYEHRFDRQQRDAMETIGRLKQRETRGDAILNKGTWEEAENNESSPISEPDLIPVEPDLNPAEPDLIPDIQGTEPEESAFIGGHSRFSATVMPCD